MPLSREAVLDRPVPAPPESTWPGKPARNAVLLEALLFFFAVFSVYLASPIIDTGDSHFVLPTALSLIRHGDANIDEYSKQFNEARWAVLKDGEHYWNVYPAGVPLLVVPLVWATDRAADFFGTDLEAAAIQKSPVFLELVLASLITALTAALLFYYFRERMSLGRSLILAAMFALGTSAYSSASRGLWQHGPSMLLLVVAILLYERLDKWKWPGAALLGFCAAYSYAIRPANLIMPIGFAVLIALTARRRLIPYACGAVLGFVPLFAFHLLAFGTWSSRYYRMTQGAIFYPLRFGPLAGLLVSPSRGLFVFSPFLLFLFLRFSAFYRRKYRPKPLEILLAALSFAWWIGTARWPFWWGGGSYGPRLLCDLLPCLMILLAPVAANLSLEGDRKATALTMLFIIVGAISIGIHFRGATDYVAQDWNATPVSIDQHPERSWDWGDPQFLRGILR